MSVNASVPVDTRPPFVHIMFVCSVHPMLCWTTPAQGRAVHCYIECTMCFTGQAKSELYRMAAAQLLLPARHPRGEICHCRQCRRQCKFFASGVNFSIFTHFVCFFLLKLLKLGEITGVKFLT